MTSGAQPDLRIGRVLKAHGVRGSVRVESLTDFPDRFAPGSQGTVAEVLTNPANDMLRVVDGARERLVPMVRSVVLRVDLPGGAITVDLPDDRAP